MTKATTAVLATAIATIVPVVSGFPAPVEGEGEVHKCTCVLE